VSYLYLRFYIFLFFFWYKFLYLFIQLIYESTQIWHLANQGLHCWVQFSNNKLQSISQKKKKLQSSVGSTPDRCQAPSISAMLTLKV